jgi:hypothetical protein
MNLYLLNALALIPVQIAFWVGQVFKPSNPTAKSDSGTSRFMLEAAAEPVMVIVRHRPFSPDANDDTVLDVAVNGNGDAIVSNNTKHFREPAKRFQVDLLSEFRKRS